MKFNERPNNESEFDRLLGHAQWPEPRVEQVSRLEDRWRTISRRRVRLMYGVCATAASVLVIAGFFAFRTKETGSKPITVAGGEPADNTDTKDPPFSEPVPLRTQPPALVSSAAQPEPAVWSAQPRDANTYEQVTLMTVSAERRSNRRAPAKPEPDDSLLEDLILALASDPRADVDERLASVERDLARYERSLWELARRGSSERRRGAARVISRIGTAQSLPILADLMNDPTTHEAGILGLCRLASVADLARLATIELDPELRRSLLSTLLARRTEESVGLYLGFVNDQNFRTDALVAAATATEPPVDLLLAFLENSQKSWRLAAAQALGRLPDPDIAERLSESVFRGVGRQEAIIALLLSSNAQAVGFLNQARQNLYLVATVQAAELQLRSLAIPERR